MMADAEDLHDQEDQVNPEPEQVVPIAPQVPAVIHRNNSRRLNNYGSADGLEFITWRDSVQAVSLICEWTTSRTIWEIKAALIEPAASRVRDILPNRFLPGPNPEDEREFRFVNDYLNALEERFLPRAASDLARVDFRNAAQQEGESLLSWHSRCRELFRRGHPREDAENCPTLIDQFIYHLRCRETKKETYRGRPATYSAALALASDAVATLAMVSDKETQGQRMLGYRGQGGAKAKIQAMNFEGFNGNEGNRDVNSVNSGRKRTKDMSKDEYARWLKDALCHYCKLKGHLKRDCMRRKNSNRGPAGGGRGIQAVVAEGRQETEPSREGN
jgi:hypothetical protein